MHLHIPFALTVSICLLSSFHICAQEEVELVNSGEAIQKGIELYDNGSFEDALDQFELVEVYDSNYVWAVYERALTHYALKEYDESIRLSKKAIKLSPDYVEAYTCLGNALDDSGQQDEAIKVYDEAIAKYPYNHLLWLNKGVLYEQNEQYKKAYEVYKDLLEFNPMFASTHLRLGLMCMNEGWVSQGMLCLTTFLMLEPASGRSLSVLSYLNVTAAGGNKDLGNVKKKTLPNEMEDIDFLVNNGVALNKKYKIPSKFDFEVLKQIHLVIDQTVEQSGEGFWWDFYVPIYQEMKAGGRFENFALYLLASAQDEDVQKQLTKNLSDVKEFQSWMGQEWYNKNKSFEKDGKTFYTAFYGNSSLMAMSENHIDGHVAGQTDYFSTSGSLSSRGVLNGEGSRDGLWYYFNADQDTTQMANYKDGELDGPYEIYHELGGVKEKGTYKDGKLTSDFYVYYPDGQVRIEEQYEEGAAVGEGKRYYPNGELQYTYVQEEGELVGSFKEYFPNGQVNDDKTFADGNLNGKRTAYYQSGQISFEEVYVDDVLEGPYKSYHENGQMESEGMAAKGNKAGDWVFYFSDGKVKEKSSFDENGKLTGKEEGFAYDGTLLYEWEYQKGDPKSMRVFDADGGVIYDAKVSGKEIYIKNYSPNRYLVSEGMAIDGKSEGLWKLYFDSEALSYERNFEDDQLNGPYTSYYINGIVEYELEFKDGMAYGPYDQRNKFGILSTKGYYKDDQAWGLWREYHYTDVLESEYYMKNGSVAHSRTDFYFNGNKQSTYAYDDEGTLAGISMYDTNGALIDSIEFPGGYGKFLLKASTGKVIRDGKYIMGEPEGPFKWYYPNGKPVTTGAFAYGERDGDWEWKRLSGEVKETGAYSYGQQIGEWKKYYFDEVLQKKGTYVNGELHGVDVGYLPSGTVEFELEYYEGSRHGESRYYAPGGELKIVRYYSYGLLVGYSYEGKDGEILPMIPIRNETADIVAYYANGQKSVEYSFEHGQFQGDFIHYNTDGSIIEKSTYKDGEQEGLSMTYLPNGKPLQVMNFKQGMLHGPYEVYDARGTLRIKANYKFDQAHGSFEYYDKTGKRTATILYNTDEIVTVSN